MQIKLKKIKLCILIPLIYLSSGCNLLRQTESPDPRYTINFLDVGQGDASLIQSPEGGFILIDAGPDADVLENYLRKKNVKTLEWILITHADRDHYFGLTGILNKFAIHKIFLPFDSSFSVEWNNLLQEINFEAIPVDTLFHGDKISFGEKATIEILWPLRTGNFTGNNSSTVAIFKNGVNRVLFSGDLEAVAENTLNQMVFLERVNLLKVSHHGSKTSSTLPFLAALSPEWAVISCDSSAYGHPHEQTIARLKQIMGTDQNILRTDVSGSITFELGEKILLLSGMKN